MTAPCRILAIDGHPAPGSFCQALLDSYCAAASDAGAEVRRITLRDLTFDPVLHGGYRGAQVLEPDLVAAQADILWSQHMVWAYPVWWGGIPGLTKGFIDRTFLPGFAFRYRKPGPWWDKLLAGRTADVIVTMDTPPWYFRFVYGGPAINQIRRTVLGFCGVKTRVHPFGSVRIEKEPARPGWLAKAARLGARVAAQTR